MLGMLRKKPNATRDQLAKRVSGSLSGKFAKIGVEEGDEIVFVRDSSDSWRLDFYPRYKHHRRKKRKPEFETIRLHRDSILNYVTTSFRRTRKGPVIAIDVPHCEADDIIATLAINATNPVVIVSSDKDFLQLVNDNISVINPDGEPHTRSYDLERHIVFGDVADSIPSVSCFGEYTLDSNRVWGLSEDNFEAFAKDGKLDMETYPRFKETYERNKNLIDFSCIPVIHSNAILEKYSEEVESVNAIMEYRNKYVE